MTFKWESAAADDSTSSKDPAGELEAAVQQQLRLLADSYSGTPAGDLLAAVLAGRKPMGALLDDEVLAPGFRSGVNAYRDLMKSLTPAENERLSREVAGLTSPSRRSRPRDQA